MPLPWATHFILSLLIAFVVTNTFASSQLSRKRQFSSPNVVTGARQKDENGHSFMRIEIRDLKEKYPDQFNLYLLALESLQKVDQRELFSFYGLATIHGRPYKTWGDAPGLPHLIGTRGYCPHNNELFLGWHRPYLALYEQVLQDHMYRMVDKAGSDQWGAAADSFRIPYWDWGQGEKGGPVPEMFMSETVEVIRLDGRQAEIRNPLYSYQFHPLEEGDFVGKWASINTTVRWPTSGDRNGTSQPDKFEQSYAEQQRSLLNIVATAFRSSTFGRFSNTIEQPHGWIHGVVGGGYDGANDTMKGHFWPLEMAAFDPIFMLHHANLDRLWAMYQAVYPERMMGQSNVGDEGTVFIDDGNWIGPDTPLMPFRQPSMRFWTTRSVWDHNVFGYTYPETRPWRFDSRVEYERSIVKTVNRLYKESTQDQLEAQQANLDSSTLMLAPDGKFTDWSIEIKASARDFPPPFVVRFELVDRSSSDPPVDAGTWMIMTPSHHRPSGLPKRSPAEDKVFTGTLSLTAHLLDQIEAKRLSSLRSEDVVPYLKESLAWKLVSSDHGPDRDLNAVKVQVFSTEATLPENKDEGISFDGTMTPHQDITFNKRQWCGVV